VVASNISGCGISSLELRRTPCFGSSGSRESDAPKSVDQGPHANSFAMSNASIAVPSDSTEEAGDVVIRPNSSRIGQMGP